MSAAARFNLTNLTLRILRRVLYWVTRTRVFPANTAELGHDPQRPVCYVLQYRHLSNLLVLTHEAEQLGLSPVLAPLRTVPGAKHSYFFVSQRAPLNIFSGTPEIVSPLMRQLVTLVLKTPNVDVQLVPVNIYWGLAPARQNSVLKALLAETWRNTGRLRQILAILMHGRHTIVRFSQPLSLRELLANAPDAKHGERKLARLLRVHFRRQRERAIGPDLSHRHTLVRSILGSAKVQAAIRHESAQKQIPLSTAEATARSITLEIAADYSYTVVRAMELFLDWLWTRLYDGIELHGFERVTAIDPGHGIVFVPCHRSHIDYLLLSFIVFRQGLTPPHIAAGSNLNMPLIGPLLRRGGAFFLRRSFKGDALYAAIFIEYLHSILQRGFPVEYFIEGGRSRSGRTLPPKAGILGMTLQGFAANPERPLVFVPVYVGYEKLMEGRTYLAELNGQGKRAESLLGLIGMVRRLRREFGKVHVNFGEPIQAADLLDVACPQWKTRQTHACESSTALRPTVDHVAFTLASRINAAAVLNPINLFALALLGTRHHVADVAALKRQILHLQSLHANSAYPGVSIGSTTSPEAIIDQAVRLGFARRQPHPLGELIWANAEQGALLGYFRNNVLHLFAVSGMIAILLSYHRELPASRMEAVVTQLYPLLRAELFLPWEPDALPAAVQSAAQALADCKLIEMETSQTLWRAPGIGDENSEALSQLGALLRPLLEHMVLLLAVLMQQGSGTLNAQELIETTWLLAQRINLLHHGMMAENAERPQFSQLLRTLIDADLVRTDDQGRLTFDQRISDPAGQAELLLEADVRDAILRIAAHHTDAANATAASTA
jgi:glycerol-3-phosphate O-acyltransferase